MVNNFINHSSLMKYFNKLLIFFLYPIYLSITLAKVQVFTKAMSSKSPFHLLKKQLSNITLAKSVSYNFKIHRTAFMIYIWEKNITTWILALYRNCNCNYI